LDQAIGIALKNNLAVETARLEKDAAEQLRHTSIDLSKTSVTADYGQMNTIHNDTRFGISQTFNSPSVYVHEHHALDADAKAAEAGYRLTEQGIRTAVRSRYYGYNSLLARKKILLRVDSLYREFYEKSALRLRHGEANILENTAAATRRQQVAVQLRQLDRDIEIVLRQFNLLLHADQPVRPDSMALRIPVDLAGKVSLASLPATSQMRYRQEASFHRWRTARSRLLPDFTIGFNSQSLIGPQVVDNQERYFTASTRFNYLNAGITLPLFFRSQTARIEASKLEYIRAGKVLDQFNLQLDAAVRDAETEVEKYNESLAFYEGDAIRNAETIIRTADEQFRSGDIDFLQWVLLVDQGIAIQTEYLNVLTRYNEAVIHLLDITNE
jgi:cobalt-zinc-cadmium resistance protein CzcA